MAGRCKQNWLVFRRHTLTIVTTQDFPVSISVTFVIRRDAALMGRRAELDGLPGILRRLREAYDALQNNTSPYASASESVLQ